MTAESKLAKIVEVTVHESESGLFVATSKDIPTLDVAMPTLEALYTEVPEVIRLMYEVKGLQVAVLTAEEPDEVVSRRYVAVPSHVAA